jgi:hypothetical protein
MSNGQSLPPGRPRKFGTRLRPAGINKPEKNFLLPLSVEMKNPCHWRHNKYPEIWCFAAAL